MLHPQAGPTNHLTPGDITVAKAIARESPIVVELSDRGI
jgi:hypothetical protein